MVAQLVEHKAENLGVTGSNPVQNTLSVNNKLYYKYIMARLPFTFINNFLQRVKNITLLTLGGVISYAANHKKFSTTFYSCQLSDIFAYEAPTSTYNLPPANLQNDEQEFELARLNRTVAPVVVYNFHSFLSQDRFFVFAKAASASFKSTVSRVINSLDSIAELFMSANWLEREAAELSGIIFQGKKDLRNLMLQFGDITAPFQKAFPTIGLKDVFYDPIKDTLSQNGATVQS